MPKKPIDYQVVRDIALALEGVEENSSPRGMSFKVNGRMLACQAIHKSAGPYTLMVRLSINEREHLIETDPNVYYITEHYEKHPALLVRLAKISRKKLKDVLERSWYFVNAKAKAS